MGTWTLNFKAIDGTDCTVRIVSPGSGTLTLTGAGEPFVMDEDSDTSLLSCVRTQTGVLRLVEEGYGDLDGLVPWSQQSHSVDFWYGNELKFSGYIQPTEAESEWSACPRIREFAVASPLSLLDTKTFEKPSTPTTYSPSDISLLDILDDIAYGLSYDYIVYPSDRATDLAKTVSSLTICPYNSDFPAHRDTADVYAPKTYTYGLEGICRALGLICYDEPGQLVFVPKESWLNGNSPKTFIRKRVTYSGGTTISPQVININNTYTLCSSQGSECFVRGLKSVEVKYDGEIVKSRGIPYDHCKLIAIDDQQSSLLFPDPEVFTCGFLELQTNEVEGYLEDVIQIQNDTLTDTGFCLTCSGNGDALGEQILMMFDLDWTRMGNFMSVKFYEHPTGLCKLHMHLKWAEILRIPGHYQSSGLLSSLGNQKRLYDPQNPTDYNEKITFRADIHCGRWHYTGRFSYPYWTTSDNPSYSYETPLHIDCETGEADCYIRDIPSEGPLTISLSLPQTPNTGKVNDCGVYANEVFAIDQFEVSHADAAFDQYNEDNTKGEVIEGNSQETDMASVTWPFTFYRDNTHLIGNSVDNSSPSYDEMFEVRTCVKADFRISSFANAHMNLYSLDGALYRLIGYSLNPRESSYTLNLLSL